MCLAAWACIGNDTPDGAIDAPIVPDGPENPMPTLGKQIDRVGRGQIKRLVIHPFSANNQLEKLSYQRDGDTKNWVTKWSAAIVGTLAVYDAISGQCGDGLFGSYQNVANVIANDQIFVETGINKTGKCVRSPSEIFNCSLSTSQTYPECGLYPGVEIAHLTTTESKGCGGLNQMQTFVDTSYNILTSNFSIKNGVTTDPDGAAQTMFPFLLPPTP